MYAIKLKKDSSIESLKAGTGPKLSAAPSLKRYVGSSVFKSYAAQWRYSLIYLKLKKFLS